MARKQYPDPRTDKKSFGELMVRIGMMVLHSLRAVIRILWFFIGGFFRMLWYMLCQIGRFFKLNWLGMRHAIREHNRALGGHFPELSGEDSVLKGQNECQCDDVGCMGMIDDSVRTIAGNLFDLMVHQMAGQFAGRSAAVDKSPENSVILTLVIQFDDA